uniref:Uncharacterized protein n=1 Tax=Anolis carolinensis TaxID=28377 RepID=A0A803TBD4_ANOCA
YLTCPFVLLNKIQTIFTSGLLQSQLALYWMWFGGLFLCSGTNDRSCSLEFPGWLYSAIRMRQSSWAESNAKMKGKVTFIQWECLRARRLRTTITIIIAGVCFHASAKFW